ncbi:protein NAR1-like isoform X2 [Coffea arabica]|uniref:Protein NAR1-like isoform X2 n=1 Tax=Coffea arabica TaxID=13443 RepID=A0A6P6UMW5_COFAR|nr:protein NAR1-like isoform X1 [Coffea arabica]
MSSEKFSATLSIGDLNDYIAPSQGCVVSFKANSNSNPKPSTSSCSSRLDKSYAGNSAKLGSAIKPLETEPVKISLNDCLACSGCITSSKTVMLEKKSLDEFLSNINKGKAVIVSVSPQSRASLGVAFGLSPLQVFKKLTTLFKALGVKAVFDTSCSRDLTLIESCYEFITRYRQCHSTTDKKSKLGLPLISSACPAWINYAEKNLGSYILPNISSVKSPQQIIGAIIKNHICQMLYQRPEDIYHVTVMPCYDKKLEAVRDAFVFQLDAQGEKIVEVDSVLTTVELLDLIKSKSVDFASLEELPLDNLLTNLDDGNLLYGVRGSSGGYAETIFRYAAKNLFGKEIVGPLNFKTIRNPNFQEVTLEVEGETVLKFALCYGLQNLIQVVKKIDSGECEYQFLEIMACPSGCLNGGGQIKRKPGESVQSLELKYLENVIEADPFENPIIKGLYTEWLDQPGSEKATKYMHTEYHPRVKSRTSQLQDW